VGVLDNGDYSSVLVYWKENNAIVLWEQDRGYNYQNGNFDPRYDLAQTRRYWRLNRDIRSPDAPSNFLITKREAREWLNDCLRFGKLYVIVR
ncbi:MAG TPA: hypothetical protein VJT71_16130, partial [Pyrinomonadaceae bacterium]|nr:hypothetical protein [Pyrinomonadaceae bacterium]